MFSAPNWSIHVIGWNLTAEEVEKHAEWMEHRIKNILLPCRISNSSDVIAVASHADVLFSFPTEQGLTARPDVPIYFEIKARGTQNKIISINGSTESFRKALQSNLANVIHGWPGREGVDVLVDIN